MGIESGQATIAGHQVKIEQRVTNIYQQKGGKWKMIHHHGDASQAMLDVLSKLQLETEKADK